QGSSQPPGSCFQPLPELRVAVGHSRRGQLLSPTFSHPLPAPGWRLLAQLPWQEGRPRLKPGVGWEQPGGAPASPSCSFSHFSLLFVNNCSLLRRLVTLISQQATLLASNEAFKKQAESASEAAKKYMEENDQLKKGAAVDGGKLDVGNAEVKLEEENRSLKADLQKLNDELASTKQSEAQPCVLTRREVQRSLLCPLLPILCQTISNKPCTHARGLPENKQIAPCSSNPNAVMLSPQASEAKWFEWGSGGTRLQLVGLDCPMLEQCTLGFSCPQCGTVAPACLGAENEGSV
ncbi:uncharacterized protein LOC111533617, partial [Piliocolobus tephrosceles]|uniref:uncharacterized protein LOC111533617 n=1 Tax=Piliocolobus tephrosceles TaxID=591936 RepID=UPI000C29A5FF